MLEEDGTWKQIPGVSGLEAGLHGDIRTLDRVVQTKRGPYLIRGRILKPHQIKGGYLQVHFRENGKSVCRLVHRLIAQAFLPNPNNLPQVNHKDCNPSNNDVSNLEWCDASYNMQYREKHGESQGHPVFAVSLKTLEVSQFQSRREASRKLGVNVRGINAVIKNSQKTAGGFWFVEDDGHAVGVVKSKLHGIGSVGLNI